MIGILTYHTGYNYGASLQAYALQTVVSKMGYKCEIFNFEPTRFKASREMITLRPTRLKECIKIVSRLPYWNSLHSRQRMFDDYTNHVLRTSELYRTEGDVIAHAKDYECIICGSDQIWNLSQDDAPAANPIFFLNFPKSQRRISYAASFGKWVKEAPNHEDIFLPWLKKFDAVSVREKSGVDYLKSVGVDCEICLDPTVLLDKDDYDSICAERQIEEKYILMFGWSTNQNLVDAAKQVSRELNLPVYNIVPPPRAMFKGIPRKLDVGPREFLSMVKHAEFVVTNSFHGTAFSTTYEKPYVSIVSGKPDTRMASLLNQLGLSDHLVTKDKLDVQAMINTDFTAVREKKAALRQSSFDFLKRSLAGL